MWRVNDAESSLEICLEDPLIGTTWFRSFSQASICELTRRSGCSMYFPEFVKSFEVAAVAGTEKRSKRFEISLLSSKTMVSSHPHSIFLERN